MIKFISILVSLFVVGYFIAHDTWMVTITGFGYEVTTSVLVLVLAVLLIFYLWHLVKKPFYWLSGYRAWYAQRRQSQKEAYLVQALKTILDQSGKSTAQILKQKGSFFDKRSDENYILEALFDPTPHVFEQLLHREGTELAGIKGLLAYAREEGDWEAASRLLYRAAEKYASETWVQQALWEAQIMQADWTESLKTLELLKKQGLVDKAEYNLRRALVLLKLGQAKEAYKLLPDHPAVALAYAKTEPSKVKSVVTALWKTAPCGEAFELFRQAIAEEKPTKQAKLIDRLIQTNPNHRVSLIAQVQVAIDNELWGVAKDHLTTYLNTYPLTASVARLMAEVERKGWHHEEEAKVWDDKAAHATDDSGWGCAICGHKTAEWDAVCPSCNAFGSIQYK